MDLEFHLQKIPSLSPMAAKIALRTLDRDPHVPTEWVMALRPALVDRSGEAASFGGTDWMTIAAIERPAIRRLPSASRAVNNATRGSGCRACGTRPSGTTTPTPTRASSARSRPTDRPAGACRSTNSDACGMVALSADHSTKAPMKIEDVKRNAFAMPLTNPAFPPGPYRFVRREFMIITYRTDPEALRAVVPEPLEVVEPSSSTSSSACPIRPASATTPSRAR